MAITEVNRTYQFGDDADVNGETWHYLVDADSAATTCTEARTASAGGTSIPAEGAGLSGTTFRAKVSAQRIAERPQSFHVTVRWESPTVNGGGGESKPAGGGKWNVNLSADEIITQEAVYKDLDGLSIANSAGERYPEGVVEDIYDELFTVEFDTDSLDTAKLAAARGKVNATSITLTIKGVARTFAVGTVRLVSARWGFVYDYTSDPDSPDYHLTLQLAYRSGGWKRKLIDQGFYVLDGSNLVRAKDDNDVEAVSPVYLDGSGGKLATGGTTVLREFRTKDNYDIGQFLP